MFKPRGKRVLIEVEKQKEVVSGLIRLDKAGYTYGTVMAVGTKCNELKIGDKVVFQKDKGTDMDIGLCIKERDILGVHNAAD